MSAEVLQVPAHRRDKLADIVAELRSIEHIVLTTHVNADGDGTGSEAAVAAWLARLGKKPYIVNPTPFPALYQHLVEDAEWIVDPADSRIDSVYRRAQALVVLDTGEPKRIGKVLNGMAERPIYIIDHHPPPESGFRNAMQLLDPTACATGELIFDLLHVANAPEPWPLACCEAIYTAIVTDTGSFRFSNTTFRTHLIAGDMIRRGVEPEETYKKLFATMPLRRVQLLRAALDNLHTDPDYRITWIIIPRSVMVETGATADDMEGLVDQARSVEGTEVALLFRETSDGGTKVSFRSNGETDVNAIARGFNGGGHVKAAGAVVGGGLENAMERVLEATRAALRGASPGG